MTINGTNDFNLNSPILVHDAIDELIFAFSANGAVSFPDNAVYFIKKL